MSAHEADVAEVESIDTQDGAPRELYAWLRLADGRAALWHYDIAKPVGQAQTLHIQGDR